MGERPRKSKSLPDKMSSSRIRLRGLGKPKGGRECPVSQPGRTASPKP